MVKVDRIGDQGRGHIGLRGSGRQHGNAVGNTQRKTASSPPTGGHTANRHAVVNQKLAIADQIH
jgi:hypothetical protein